MTQRKSISKTITLYTDMLSIVDAISEKQRSDLLLAFYHYHYDGILPEMDETTSILFSMFKHKFEKDKNISKEHSKSKSEAGRLGNLKKWNLELYNRVIAKQFTLDDAYKIHFHLQEDDWKGYADKSRNTKEYRLWRDKVFARDGYTCQKCHKYDLKLNAHHIEPFIKNPELRYDLSNGITLCVKCHREEHKNAR